MEFTLLADGTPHTLTAARDGDRLRVEASGVERALGWHLEAQGLCRGDVCIPVRDRDALVHGDALDLETLGGLLERPLAADADEGVAVLGESAGDRAAALESLTAPDFALPDLAGRTHRLSEHRGKKVLLIAYASW